MTSGISTHVLDTAAGHPASGIPVHLWRDGAEIGSSVTDQNGRCGALMPGRSLAPGTYRLVFDVAAYFPDGFYPEVSITFQVFDPDSHYHVPLLLSPFGFTTYRGS
jgi:5-hydroxyisourate hydrolase